MVTLERRMFSFMDVSLTIKQINLICLKLNSFPC